MQIEVFGKDDCIKCDEAKSVLNKLLEEKSLKDKVQFRYFDMESIDGMAEGAFNDVLKIPTILINDQDKNLARWDGNVPQASEISTYLQ